MLMLPLELVDIVVDHLSPDDAALRSIALTARLCVRRSRRHLFRQIVLPADQLLAFLFLIASPSSTVASAVHELRIVNGPAGKVWDVKVSHLAAAIGALPSLRTLSVEGIRITPADSNMFILQKLSLPVRKHLDKLTILQCHAALADDILDVVTLVNSITHLTLGDISITKDVSRSKTQRHLQDAKHASRVRELTYFRNHHTSTLTSRLMESLLAATLSSSFARMTIDIMPRTRVVNNYAAYNAFLQTVGENLTTLTIQLPLVAKTRNAPGHGLQPYTPSLPSISQCHSLQTIDIRACITIGLRPWLDALKILHTIPSCAPIANVNIRISMDHDSVRNTHLDQVFSDEGWSVLAENLARFGRSTVSCDHDRHRPGEQGMGCPEIRVHFTTLEDVPCTIRPAQRNSVQKMLDNLGQPACVVDSPAS